MAMIGRVRNVAFAACTAVALGFGASQAVASPAEAKAGAARACAPGDCAYYCRDEWCPAGERCWGYCSDTECICVIS